MESAKKRERSSANDETGDVASVTPKKKGRPANPDKIKKAPSGRGRGRPPKNPLMVVKKVASDDSDGGIDLNGTGRGRPKKDSVSRGRGRPKIVPKTDDEEDDVEDYQSSDNNKSGKKPGRKPKSPQKKQGRNKITQSDGEASEEERHIREAGRTKKAVNAKSANGSGIPKKRGRPLGSGKGRGRPKTSSQKSSGDSQDEVDDNVSTEENDDASTEENDKDGKKTEDDDMENSDEGDEPGSERTAA